MSYSTSNFCRSCRAQSAPRKRHTERGGETEKEFFLENFFFKRTGANYNMLGSSYICPSGQDVLERQVAKGTMNIDLKS